MLSNMGYMRSSLIDLPEAEGQLLATVILDPSGKKIIARGHRLERGDLQVLRQRGLQQVWVVELSPDDRGEDQVLGLLAPRVASGPWEVRPAPGGRADLVATERSALLVDPMRLAHFNSSGVAVLCTLPQFAMVEAGERFATLRSYPFAAPAEAVEGLRQDLATTGPLLDLKPICDPRVTVIYADPANPERARELFGPLVRRRAEMYGFTPQQRTALEEEPALISALKDSLRRTQELVLIASTISPLTPADVIGRAIVAVGGRVAHFLVPVEPGSLLLLGYVGEMAIVAATGCFRSPKQNLLDLLLPPLLARHLLTPCSLAPLGLGGLRG